MWKRKSLAIAIPLLVVGVAAYLQDTYDEPEQDVPVIQEEDAQDVE